MKPETTDPTISSNNLKNCVYILQYTLKNVLQKGKKNTLQFLVDVDFPMKHYHPLSGFYPLKALPIYRAFFQFLSASVNKCNRENGLAAI